MSKDIVNIGLVGCGNVAKQHIKAIKEIEDANIVAVCSRNEIKSRLFAKEHNIPIIYTDFHSMLCDKNIDLLDILTPSGLHANMVVEAARFGKHVIVEKPMDITLEKADLMIEASREYGVKLSVILQHRFDPATEVIKKAIWAGKFGRLILADAHIKWSRNQEYYDNDEWRGTWNLDGGGVLMNQGIHTLDLLLYFMGDIDDVCAYYDTLAHDRIEVEDVATAAVRFKNGAMATISATTGAYPWLPVGLEINGTKGTAKIEQ